MKKYQVYLQEALHRNISFIKTCFWNTAVFFLPFALVLFALTIGNGLDQGIVMGVWLILLGNLIAYLLIAFLYYWKSGERQLDDENVRAYFSNHKISLRPWTGYTEIITFVFFFLVRPEIIVGYLVLRGIVGYRKNVNTGIMHAENTGELNAIKAIGLFLNLFIAVFVAAMLQHSTAQRFIYDYWSWLAK